MLRKLNYVFIYKKPNNKTIMDLINILISPVVSINIDKAVSSVQVNILLSSETENKYIRDMKNNFIYITQLNKIRRML